MVKTSIIFTALILCLTGCATTRSNLIDNPNKAIRYPSNVGLAAGSIVGAPTTIVLLPVTGIIAEFTTGPLELPLVLTYPFWACQNTGALIIGGIPWLVFGGWTDVNSEEQPENKEISNKN